uniref:P-type ATPase C-terminal domain-containing protein n=1 Tax=Coccolithus braarudii TaxID=221442 RepID=A0A7S0LK09_9EUKA
MLVHGRQNHLRYATFFYFAFYQTTAYVSSLVFYSMFTLSSVQPLYNDWMLVFLTVFYTSLPLIVVGFSDQDVPKALSAVSPTRYTSGIKRAHLTSAAFNRIIVEGFYVGLVLAYMPGACLGWGNGMSLWTSKGDPAWSDLSFTAYNALVVILNLRLALEVHSWTVLEAAAWLLMLAALVLTNLMFSYWIPVPFPSMTQSQWADFSDSIAITHAQLAWWLCFVMVILLGILPGLIPSPPAGLAAWLPRCLVPRDLLNAPEKISQRSREQVDSAWLSLPSLPKAASSGVANFFRKSRPQPEPDHSYEPSARPMEISARFSQGSSRPTLGKMGQSGFVFSQDDRSAANVLIARSDRVSPKLA